MTSCKGCGAIIQTIDKNEKGYSPKSDVMYCQRCFRLTHYNDPVFSMRTGVPPHEVIEQLHHTKGLIVWVCDLFDFEGSMILPLNRYCAHRPIWMVLTKRDLFSKDISDHRIQMFVNERLKFYHLKVEGIIITNDHDYKHRDMIKDVIVQNSIHNEVVVVGKANVGKSSFLNFLLQSKNLTKSVYPGTTLAFNRIQDGNITFIDTPGIEVSDSMLQKVNESELEAIVPQAMIRPRTFQIYSPQSFAIGGLVRVDIDTNEKTSVTFHIANQLNIHRGKLENANHLWGTQKGRLLKPTVDAPWVKLPIKNVHDRMDIVIDGLGFLTVSHPVVLHVVEGVQVTVRKAML